ncbi:apolipoprotein N-acyltransferase [Kordia sp.]|uniref:apolipoprotein N-acyltransferase n=1 Tax=Kordia sp. TaxID=1965332 RepID=UPI0025BD15B2|nr:apolipoprotein N-acyltransferase [Kordia sp.]MCH2080923.1 apolipoprotein N-acyltransferase [Saprospiraceae bacterium]MCH2193283.1 apolipoprotein N-acyltransferase [Kordia sp.]
MKKRLPYILGLGFLIVLGITTTSMYLRSQEELLWAYRPLFFFLSLWGLIMSIGYSYLSKLPNKARLLGLSTLSGVLLGVGFPDLIPVPFLMFIGFIPLLLVEDEISKQQPKRAGWQVTKFAFHTFVVWNIISTYWVGNAALGGGFFAIWVNAALMCIPFLLFHLTKRATPKLANISFIAYWFSFEYIHLNWDLTWPWLTLGNSFAEYPSLVQWYEFTGVFGGGLWILAINVWGYQLYQHYKVERQIARGLASRIGITLILPMVISLVMYYNYEEQGEDASVVVVQPNYEPHYVKFKIREKDQVQHFLNLSEQKLDENTDYLVFPESSFGTSRYVRINTIDRHRSIRTLKEFVAKYPQLNIVSGINAYYDFGPNEAFSDAVRGRKSGSKTIFYETLNCGIQINAASDTIPIYKKSKLVPGPENFPFQALLFFMKPLVKKLGGTTAGVGSQENRDAFESTSGKAAPVICYESVFGDYFRGYILAGADLAFIMTNDGWWDNTAGHRQHLLFGALRAIETRRAIARSANTGISCFINQRGDVLQATNYDEAAVIRQNLKKNKKITIYVQWGDAIARIALFLSMLLLVNLFVKSRMKEEQ